MNPVPVSLLSTLIAMSEPPLSALTELPMEALLPQRRPMPLIDRVLDGNDTFAVTESVVGSEWPLAAENGMAALTLIEVAPQTAGISRSWQRIRAESKTGGFGQQEFTMRAVLLALVLVLLAPVFAAQAAPAPPKIALQSVQANFFQEKHLKILAQPVTARGVFAFQAPRSLRWEYLYPVHTLLLVHNSDIQKLVEQDGELVADRGMSLDSMRLVLEEITNWLAGRFTDNPSFAASFPKPGTIVLTPKDQGLATVISRIDLHLAKGGPLLESVVIHEGPDAFTRLTFSDAELNRKLDASLFTKP